MTKTYDITHPDGTVTRFTGTMRDALTQARRIARAHGGGLTCVDRVNFNVIGEITMPVARYEMINGVAVDHRAR